ncbi:hypothetical protein Adu01nite_36740 [Paractinoplanes durhamensis]|uniref:Secreted protein n=1 Tax=Paractinoplanes durhamensis TaxID=113563 RepID=A0ABQ3YYF0_9ACTN|nr:hypothetical protein Adu01nite_36740 [Actinoplanes durhamensis]
MTCLVVVPVQPSGGGVAAAGSSFAAAAMVDSWPALPGNPAMISISPARHATIRRAVTFVPIAAPGSIDEHPAK